MTRLETFGRACGDFIETIGADALAVLIIVLIGLRGLPWIIGSMANG